MEKRNIQLTLEEAKRLYNEGDTTMKSLILTSFTKDELKMTDFSEIKSFEDACKVLGIDEQMYIDVPFKAHSISNHLIAIYKLDIICKALNGNWRPSLIENKIHYPIVKFFPIDSAIKTAKDNNWKICHTFYIGSEKYYLVGGIYDSYYGDGLGAFDSGWGLVSLDLGLLSCKSKEIAEHMSTYFAKEIFEACYAQYIGMYEWTI